MAWVEATLGVPMEAGGRHPTMGTHNTLLRLSDSSYLEVIAIDPDAPRPSWPRWFGLDMLASDDQPRLSTWVARVTDIDRDASASAEPLGAVHEMSRGSFSWRITVREDGRLLLGGIIPALIAWSSGHPALGLTDQGCRLVRLDGRHPDAERVGRALRALDLHDLDLAASAPGEPAGLSATIETPTGLRVLGARP